MEWEVALIFTHVWLCRVHVGRGRGGCDRTSSMGRVLLVKSVIVLEIMPARV